jgi:beta-ribofuranosylaminobenzene 5'-phosphate synthase
MNRRTVHVTAPSRLHFGMFSFGQPNVRQFGGVGCMIDRPGIQLAITPAENFEVSGPLADRVRHFAEMFLRTSRFSAEIHCRIEIQSAPRPHVGLGSGTQLGLSVAAGLQTFLRGTVSQQPEELANAVGRGRRSAIGAHGFVRGGLLIEAGKLADGELSPLLVRAALPAEWRFVLLCPKNIEGLSGDAERRAFEEQLPAVPVQTTDALCREAFLQLLPAAIEGRFAEFSESLFRFGRTAGSCFAAIQGGPYGGEQVTRLVEQCRALGVRGVGQTSWGPTVFALLPDEPAANAFALQLKADRNDLDITIASPNQTGAHIDIRDPNEAFPTRSG